MKKILFITLFNFLIFHCSIAQTMFGEYTIGNDNCDFATIKEAFSQLETFGIEGNTVLLLTNSYKSEEEPFELSLGVINGTSNDKKVILSVAEDVYQISLGSQYLYNFSFTNTEYFEIQGQGKLTLQLNTKLIGAAAVAIFGTDTKISISGCVIDGNENTLDNSVGVYFYSSGNNQTAKNYDISISNNIIRGVNIGILAEEQMNSLLSNSTFKIADNVIGDNRESYLIRECGIRSVNQSRIIIEGNNIFSVVSSVNATGIEVKNGAYCVIDKNFIHDILSSGKAQAINISSDESTFIETRIYNNMISHIAAVEAEGVLFDSYNMASNQLYLYYNSIYLCVDNSFYSENTSACLHVTAITSTIIAKNNIFQNSFGDNGIAIFFDSDVNPFSSITNNIFYTNGYTASNYEQVFSFEEWNDFNDYDTTSLNTNPNFVSTYLPKILLSNHAGTPIQGVSKDYFNKNRNSVTPDIGAHEQQDNSSIFIYNTINITAYYTNNGLVINSDEVLNGRVFLTSIDGKTILSANIKGSNSVIPLNGVTKNNICIFSYYGNDGKRYSKKIFIN